MENSRDYFGRAGRNVFNLGILALLGFSTASMFYSCIREAVNYFHKQDIILVRDYQSHSEFEKKQSQLEKKVENN